MNRLCWQPLWHGATICSSGGDTFAYDPENHMTQAVVGGTTTAYTYNGDGVRTRKQITGGATTDYYQDINGKLPLVAAEKVGTDWTYYVYGKSLIAKRELDGTPKHYHYDGSGNVRAVTDATGAVVERYDYDGFGGLRSTAPTSSPANDRRFSGEQNDGETGLVFLRARYYDPAIGRFTSEDPLQGNVRQPQSLNDYAYAGNNPVGFSDRNGKCGPFCVIGVVALASLAGGIVSEIHQAMQGHPIDPFETGISAAGAGVAGGAGVGVATLGAEGVVAAAFAGVVNGAVAVDTNGAINIHNGDPANMNAGSAWAAAAFGSLGVVIGEVLTGLLSSTIVDEVAEVIGNTVGNIVAISGAEIPGVIADKNSDSGQVDDSDLINPTGLE